MAQHELQSTIVLNGRVDASANTLASFLDGLGNSLLTIGGTMGTISTPLKGVLTDAVSLYAEFEDHMLYIQGLGDLTKQQAETMAAAARELGATTRYTATQAAEALEFNAVAGKSYSESLDLLGVEATMAAAGNMDLDRFRAEALAPALAGQPIPYRAYSCQHKQYLETITLPPTLLTVVEGSYSHHPSLAPYCQRRVFLTCSKEAQTRRLQAREGAHYAAFTARWIPMEELYYRACGIPAADALVLDTSDLF